MEIEVTGSKSPIEIGAQGIAEVVQNVKIILTTMKGSVPLDRTFGIDASFLDQPEPVAKALLASQIVEEVERYEPRVKIAGMTWEETDTMDGCLKPKIKIIIEES